MDARITRIVESFPQGSVWPGAPLSSFTTWSVGGPAEVLIQPENAEEAVLAVRMAVDQDLACRVLGGGSNLLVSDEGIDGVVIRPSVRFNKSDFNGSVVVCEPARRLPSLSRKCAEQGLAGLEFAIGIPGSVGGAAATNAGAEGSQMNDVVREICVLRRLGTKETWDRPSLKYGYRHSRLLDEPALVLSVTLALETADPVHVRRRTRTLLEKRKRQPAGRSAGSVFRNPEGQYAGKLLDQVGAKGMSMGGARVSEIHANFILTEEGARAGDVLRLIRTLQDRVFKETGVLLSPEIIFAGFDRGDPDLPKNARLLGEIT